VTRSAEELLGLTTDPDNLTDSPDLGPPPVAHFEEGDPIKFDHSQNQSSPLELAIDEENPVLSPNLETRKKRRESSYSQGLGVDKAWTDVARIVSSIETGTGQPSKSGAKRKLDVREEGDPSEGTCIQEKEDFEYSRRTSDMRRLDTATSKPIINKASKSSESKTSQKAPSSKQHRREKSVDLPTAGANKTRTALGPSKHSRNLHLRFPSNSFTESVNTDTMNSPLKSSKSNGKDKVADAKDDLSRIVRERSRSKAKPQPKGIGQSKEREVPATIMTVSAVEKPIEPSPETPAPQPDDLFSPNSTEASAPRADSRDTPPPPDLGPDTGTGSFGRGSRRPRGAVNYAQPNLRDKMRRPTAELVDAVAAEERARQARTAVAESQQSQLMNIKQEDLSDGLPIWKTNEPNDGRQREEPTSPLSYRSGILSNELPSSVITDRRRRTIAPSRNNEENKPIEPYSGAASAIAALTAGSKRAKMDKPRPGKTGDEFTHEAAERTSIYDFTGSSPNIGDGIEDPGGSDGGNKPSRSSRRHSTVLASSDQGRGSLSISRRAERERRRESVLDARHDESMGKAPVPSVARTRGVLLDPGADDGAEVTMTMGRNERAASRRRSMML
jgi:hypothetical protein